MNRYTISSVSLIEPYEENKKEDFKRALQQTVKSFAHCVLFGEDQRVQTMIVASGVAAGFRSSKGSNITFSLPYSLSSVADEKFINQFTKANPDYGLNILLAETSITPAFSESSYATNSQEVREYVDKPYPRKGFLVCFLIDEGDTDYRGDLDGYVKVPFSYYQAIKVSDEATRYEIVRKEIVFGYVNSSQTDFYKPLAKYVASGLIEIIDASSANIETIYQAGSTLHSDVQNALKNGSFNGRQIIGGASISPLINMK